MPLGDKGVRPCPFAERMCGGGVAQLGERSVRNAEVEGSTPFASTLKATCVARKWLFFARMKRVWLDSHVANVGRHLFCALDWPPVVLLGALPVQHAFWARTGLETFALPTSFSVVM